MPAKKVGVMREFFDFFMITAFVLFMIFMVRGFMLQSAERNRDNIDK
jgi:flagellar biogenesis protein FliO